MVYKLVANAVALLHLGFIVFVILGGFVVLRWRHAMWLHLPAAVWGPAIEFGGWHCPLTLLENWALRKAGEAGYDGGFLAHYLFAVIYPAGLTRGLEIAIGIFVLVVNIALYATVL